MGRQQDEISKMSKNELEREVRHLRSLLEQSKVSIDDLEIVQSGSKAALETAMRQRDQYKRERDLTRAELEHFQQLIFSEMMEKQSDKTIVGATIMTREAGENRISVRLVHPQEYSGTTEEAIGELLPQIVFALARIPSPQEIGKQAIDGISDGQLLLIMENLARAYNQDPENFQQARRAKFEEVWTYLEENYPNEYDRFTVQDQFNKIVKRTFDRLNQRRETLSVDLDDFRQLLS